MQRVRGRIWQMLKHAMRGVKETQISSSVDMGAGMEWESEHKVPRKKECKSINMPDRRMNH